MKMNSIAFCGKEGKMIIDIREYGAVGDGKTLNTEKIQKAIDDCMVAGGGRVVIAGGKYMTGTVCLKQNVELHLEADGVLFASPDCADFPQDRPVCHVETKKLPRWSNSCLVYAEECENIAITGNGVLDCNGDAFTELADNNAGWLYRRKDSLTPSRVIFVTGCKNVKFEDFTMINQPAGWSIWIHDCDYVTADKLKIEADVNYPNNDGIHINSSRNVTVSNCCIRCGDDCIIVRANNVSLKENKVCERVTVTNCNLTSYSSGIRIGWMNDGIIRNCTFSNIVMTDCWCGVGIKLPYMKYDPEKFQTADQGREETLIENLIFSNIVCDRHHSASVRFEISQNEGAMCKAIRNIYFNGFHARGLAYPYLHGRKSCHLQNIHFSDCTFEVTDEQETDPNFLRRKWELSQEHMVTRYVDGLAFNNTAFITK